MRWLWILAIILVIVPFAAATELADYGNVTSYYYNITTGMGTQTDYQVKFILSNSSGVSGYYAPDNIIYTNGTTRPDWYDINATDASNTPLKFWVENNTATAYNITAWVKVPSIATGNTSTGKWYYGNASQSASTMDGLNTFPLFDDFIASSVNTTQWVITGTPSISGGIITLPSAGAGATLANSTRGFGYNFTFTSLTKFQNSTKTGHNIGFAFPAGYATFSELATTDPGTRGRAYTTSNVYSATISSSNPTSLYERRTVKRTGGSIASYSINYGSETTISDAQVPDTDLTAIIGNWEDATSLKDIYFDWVFVRKSVSTEPITSLYTTTGGTTINASFTQSDNPSTVGQAVTFTDTSTGTPTTWNWTFGDGNTSTTQNPTYAFPDAGSFWVDLNVTNSTGSFSNYTALHTVVNASSFTPQDVWMEGQYNRTFHFTSSSDATPLAANWITSDGQSGTASTLGYAFVTEGFGVYTITASMTDYATRTVSFIVDEDGTTEIQLTPSSSQNPNTNIIYTPHQVRIYTVDAYGVPLIGTNITINYLASSLPSTDTNWLIKAYGIEAGVAADMVNSSVAMTGHSADDGSNTFTLFGSLTYGITLTNATVGANCYKKLAPIDASYRIYCPITGQTAVNNTLTAVNASRLTFYRLNATGGYNLSMIYQDSQGYTTNLVFNVYDYSAGRTLVYTKDWGNPGTAQVVDNYTVMVPLGKEYQWQYNATKV